MKFVLLGAAALILIAVIVFAWAATSMPGRSFRGALPPITPAQKTLAAELKHDVARICATEARHEQIPFAEDEFGNRVMEIRGTTDEIVVVGAHFDAIDDLPGADDNASGVAALLALARRFENAKPRRTIRFVAFANEEPPHFRTVNMGSWQYARRAHERGDRIVAMLSLEMLGYYGGPQAYPPPLSMLYPKEGNFVAFAGNMKSRPLIRRCAASFRKHAAFPSEGAALPQAIDEIGWSDQWSFWQFGYPALMVTDTGFFRNANYHTPTDTPDTLDYESFARVVEGLVTVISELGSG